MTRWFATAALVLLATTWLPSSGAAGQEPAQHSIVLYEAPMLTRVVDPFRPPSHIGAAGNRGLEYGDSDGQIVAAAAAGYVLFAGPVAGRNVITVVHDDGVRTTYTGLLEVWVTEGGYVSQHAAIAVASTGFHFGARINEHYLDPQILIDASKPDEHVRLVPQPG